MVNFYEQYQNRILKLAKFKRALYKFRFLLIGLLALLIAGISALLATKGLVTDGMSLSATEVYFNEDFEVTPAKAFLVTEGSQKIEYRLIKDVHGNDVDSGWTDVKPDLVGTYQVRTVLPKAIGVGYSDVMELRILPIEANIKLGDTVRYGDKPECTIPELVDGNVVSLEDLDFEYEDITKTKTKVNVVEDSLKIVKNVNGEFVDYTDCYNFNYENNTNFVPSPITILFREITIAPVSMEYEYDGKQVNYVADVSEVTKLDLAKGDRIEITARIFRGGYETVPVNAGTYNVSVRDGEYRIINSKNIDVTDHYKRVNANSSASRGTIIIAQRKITVTTNSHTKEYDGEALYDATVNCDNLVNGHSISAHGTVRRVTDVTPDPVLNEFVCRVYDGTDDVTANYDITYDYGTLEITPFIVTYSTEGAVKVYDGQPLSGNGYTFKKDGVNIDNDIVHGKYSVEASYNSITDAGEERNTVKFTVYNSLHQIVTSNFRFVEEKDGIGTLKITKRPVTITTKSGSWVYDGTNKSLQEYSSVVGLVLHHIVIASNNDGDYTVVNGAVSSVDNVVTFRILGTKDVTDNYDITYVYGKLTVTPRPIVIETLSHEWIYDGEEHSFCGESSEGLTYKTYYYLKDSNGNSLPVAGLIGNDKLILKDGYASLTHVNYETVGDNKTVKGIPNVCAYDLPNSNYVIDTVAGFVNGYKYGTITVNPRPIVVKTGSAEREYDGNALTNTSYTTYYGDYDSKNYDVNKAGLIGDDTLTLYTTFDEAVNVSEHINKCVFTASGDYTLSYQYGVLKVKPRQLYVVTATHTWEYDGEYHSDTSKEVYHAVYSDDKKDYVKDEDVDAKGLIGEDVLVLSDDSSNPATIINFGGVKNNCLYTPKTKGEDGKFTSTGNYNIHYEVGMLLVSPRPIMVKTKSYSKIYDGKVYSDSEPEYIAYADKITDGDEVTWSANFAKGGLKVNAATGKLDELKVVYASEFADVCYDEFGNVCEQDNVCTYLNVNLNYHIHYEYGKVRIDVRNIIVYQLGEKWVYDGKEHTYCGEVGGLKTYSTYFVNKDSSGKWYVVTEDNAYVSGLALPEDSLTVISSTTVKDVTGEQGVKNVVTYAVPNGNYALATDFNGKITVDKDERIFENGYCYGNLIVSLHGITVYANDILGVIYGDSFSYATEQAGNYKSTAECPAPALADNHLLKITRVLYYKDLDTATADTENKFYVEPKHVGTYVIKIVAFKIFVDGDETETDISSNYTVLTKCGYITIVAKEIEVSAKDMVDIIYGNKDFVYVIETGNYKSTETNPAPDMQYADELEISEIKYYNKAVNGDRSTVNEDPTFAGEYYIGIQRIKIYDVVYGEKKLVGEYYFDSVWQDGDGKENFMTFRVNGDDPEDYRIKIKDGLLKINRRKITVYLEDVTVKYGDYDFFADNVYRIEGKNYKVGENVRPDLVFDDELTIGYVKYFVKVTDTLRGTPITPKDVATYFIAADEEKTTINGTPYGDGSGSNYDITYIDGLLTIEKKIIQSVSLPKGIQLTYGEAMPEYFDYDDPDGVMEYGEKLRIYVKYQKGGVDCKKYTVGDYEIVATRYVVVADVIDDNDSFILDNYDIEACSVGGITIIAKKITVSLEDVDVVYGEYDFATDKVYRIKDKNYKTGEDAPALADGDSLVVDADAVEYFEIISVGGDGVAGDKVTPKNAKSYFIAQNGYSVYSGEGENKVKIDNDNYEITWKFGLLTIAKKDVEVEIEDKIIYYGDALLPTGYDYSIKMGEEEVDRLGKLAYGEMLNISVFFTLNESGETVEAPKNKGVYTVKAEVLEIYELIDGNKSVISYYNVVANGGVFDASKNLGWDNYNITCVDGKLTIKPREITVYINDYDDIAYGEYDFAALNVYATLFGTEFGNFKDTPECPAPAMAYGEKLTINSVRYCKDGEDISTASPVTPKNIGKYLLTANGYTITETNGTETTDDDTAVDIANYKITWVNGSFEIVKREITVTAVTETVVYGKKPLPKVSISCGTEADYVLPYGEALKLFFTYNGDCYDENNIPTDAGNYAIGFLKDDTVVQYEGEDGAIITVNTDNYNITYVGGNITVDQKEITVKFDTVNISYGDDHEALILAAATVDGCEFDQTITLALSYGDGVTVKNAGDYTATLVWDDCNVYDKDGNEIATVGGKGGIANYKLSSDSDPSLNFTIGKRSIKVEIDDQGSVYGDSLPVDFGYTFASGDIDGALPYGDVLDVEYIYNCGEDKDVTPKDAKDYDISYSSFVIYAAGDASKTDISSVNYDCTIIDGTLTVGKRPILVTTGSASKIYDGTPLTAEDYEKVEYAVMQDIDGEEVWVASSEKVGLLDGDSLTVVEDSVTSITDADVVDNTTLYSNDNYDIHYVYGQLEVKRRFVIFSLEDLHLSYVYGQKLPEGGEIEWNPNVSFPDTVYCEFVLFSVNDGAIAEQFNVGWYYLTVGAVRVNEGTEKEERVEANPLAPYGNGVIDTKNFNIYVEHGTLRINPRHISVVTPSGEWIYDGEEHYAIESFETRYYLTDGKGNFILDDDGNKLFEEGLVGGDTLTVTKFTTVTNFNGDGVANKCEFNLPLFDGENSNYVIDGCESGTLKVTKRNIIVYTADHSYDPWQYDGKPHSDTSYEAYLARYDEEAGWVRVDPLTGGMVGEDELTVKDDPASLDKINFIPNANEYNVPKVKDGDGNEIENYEIVDYVYGFLVVGRRDVTVYLNDVVVTYGDYDFATQEVYGISLGNHKDTEDYPAPDFVHGEKIRIDSVYYYDGDDFTSIVPKNAGEYRIFPAVHTLFESDGVTVSHTGYYNISFSYGSLTINKADLTVDFDSSTPTVVCGDNMSVRIINELKNHLSVVGLKTAGGYDDAFNKINWALKYTDENGNETDVPVVSGDYTVTIDWDNTTIGSEYLVTDNYNVISTVPSITLKVVEKELKLTLLAESVVYNGGSQYYSVDGDHVTLIDLDIKDGDNKITDFVLAFVYTDEETGEPVTDPLNSGTYIAEIDWAKTVINGNVAQDFYALSGDSTRRVKFTIEKKAVTVYVSDLRITYGDTPKYTVENQNYKLGSKTPDLCSGDKIRITEVEYRKDNKALPDDYKFVVDKYEIVATDFEMYSAMGKLISSDNYKVTFEKGELNVVKKEITVQIADMQSDVSLEREGHTEDLIMDEILEFSVDFEDADDPIKPGRYVIYAVKARIKLTVGENSYEIVEDYADVKNGTVQFENYDVKFEKGTLIVLGMNITVTKKAELSKVYDGNPLSVKNDFDVLDTIESVSYVRYSRLESGYIEESYGEELPEGIKLVIEVDCFTEDGNVQSKDNTATYMLGYEDGYSEATFGVCILTVINNGAHIEIKPCEVEIKIGTIKREYGEAAPATATYDCGNDIFAEVTYVYTSGNKKVDNPKLVGTYQVSIDFENYAVYRQDGIEKDYLTGNYVINVINVEKGTLDITPRNIIIENETVNKPYDGLNLAATWANVYYAVYDADNSTWVKDVTKPALAYEDGVKSFKVTKSVEYKDVCNKLNDTRFENSNYNIVKYIDGTITVTQLDLIVTIDNKEVAYGDNISIDFKIKYGENDNYSLPAKETLSLLFIFIDEEGNRSSDVPVNVGTYTVTVDKTLTSVGNGGSISNYNITQYVDGTLTITPRYIIVQTEGKTWTYNGTGYSCTDYRTYLARKNGDKWEKITNTNGLLPGDTLEIVNYTTVTDPATNVDNEITFKAPDNYEIVGSLWGKLTVKPVTVEIRFDGVDLTYGDSVPTATSAGTYFTVSNLIEGDEIEVTGFVYYEVKNGRRGNLVDNPKNAGSYQITTTADYIVLKSCSHDGIHSLGGYQFSIKHGAMTINPKEITVDLGEDIVTVYTGEEQTYEYSGAAIVGAYNETINVSDAISLYNSSNKLVSAAKNAGTYTVKLNKGKCTVVTATGGTGLIKNYSIICEDVNLVINKIQGTIKLVEDAESEYGDRITEEYEYEIVGDDFLVEGEELTVRVSFYRNSIECKDEDKLESVPTTPGTYYVKFDESKSTIGRKDSVSLNYEITCENIVTFTIEARTIELKFYDISKVYDGSVFNFVTQEGMILGEDGEKVSGFGYEFTNLIDELEAPTIVVRYDGEPRNAGTYTIWLDSVTFPEEGVYRFENDPVFAGLSCQLIIEQRIIEIELTGDVNSKDAKDIIVEVADISSTGSITYPTFGNVKATATNDTGDGIVECDRDYVVFTYDEETKKPTGYGEYALSLILDSSKDEDYDVTQNYEFASDVKGCKFVICKRHVTVTPSINGDSSYTMKYGNTLSEGAFGVLHNHPEAVDLSDMDGFKTFYDGMQFVITITKLASNQNEVDEDVCTITHTYSVNHGIVSWINVSCDGNIPKDAGNYVLNVSVSNVPDSEKIYIESNPATLKIERKEIIVSLKETPSASYDYGEIGMDAFTNSPGKYDKYTVEEIIWNDDVTVKIAVYDGENSVDAEKFDAGTYTVRAVMTGDRSGNYSIEFVECNFTVKPLIYAITPVAPKAEVYAGQTVTLASSGYQLWSVSSSTVTKVDDNDLFTISVTSEELRYPVFSKKVTFEKVTINGTEITVANGNTCVEVGKNYVVYYAYDIAIRRAFSANDFTAELSYAPFDVDYTLDLVGATYKYTGGTATYYGGFNVNKPFDVITFVNGTGLYPGHNISLKDNQVTIGPEIGVYKNWFNELIEITAKVDGEDVDVTAFYNFINVYNKSYLEIAQSDIVIDGLDSGDFASATPEPQLYNFDVIRSEYSITLNGGGLGNLKVALIKPDSVSGNVIRVVIYEINTRNQLVDVSEYYNVVINGDFASAFQVISLYELENSKRAATVTVNKSLPADLTLADFTEVKGYYVLNDSSSYYTVSGMVSNATVGIFAYVGADGQLKLAYSAYSTTRSGSLADENETYDISFEGKPLGYVIPRMTLDEILKASNVITIDVTSLTTEGPDEKGNTVLLATSYDVTLTIKGVDVTLTRNSEDHTFVLSSVTYHVRIVKVGSAYKVVIYSEIVRGSSRNPIISRTDYTHTYTVVTAMGSAATVEEGSLSDIVF